MRILKRNLAFMLAMIMALSLTAFAGYEDYPDVDELTYVEAVDVLTELGIVEGSNGKLLPTGNLTRAQAAKLIAYTMLGKKSADALQADTATFVDVPTYHWAAGYVEYCANEGIVGGNGDGTFAPEANVTGSAFAKMLLCAVGYGQNGEFTGPTWDATVNALATKLGVFDNNLDIVFKNAVTREEAFLYTFNALTKVMEVTYSADADEYYAGTVFNSIKGFDFDETLGAKLYDLKTKAATDVFGRDSYNWYKGAKKIAGMYHEEANATYTAAVKSSKLFEDLNLDESTKATVIRNGEKKANFQIKKNDSTKIGGNGVLLEAYVDEDLNVTLIMIDTYLAKVTNIRNDDVTMKVWMDLDSTTETMAVETAMDLEEDQYILVTIADDEIQTIAIPEEVNGKLEKRGLTSTYATVDGTKYSYAEKLDKHADSEVYDYNYDDEMVVLLDEYGYMIALMPVAKANNIDGYVLVTDSEVQAGGLASTDKALVEVLWLDGTGYEVLNLQTQRKTVSGERYTQWKGVDGAWNNITRDDEDMIPYGFYAYTMTEDGEIALKSLCTGKRTEAEILSKVAGAKVDAGDFVWGNDTTATITANGKQEIVFGSNVKNLVMDNETVLNLVTSKDVEVVEGYKNIKLNEADVDALVIYSGRTISEIYVVDGNLFNKTYAYYNGEELIESTKLGKAYIELYVDGVLTEYDFTDLYKTQFSEEKPTEGVYEIEVEDGVLTRMDAEKYEYYHNAIVEEDRAKNFDIQYKDDSDLTEKTGKVDYLTYAVDVEIYDLTDDGAALDAVAEGDEIVFIENDLGNGEVVTHIWVLKHYSKTAPVDPDAADYAVKYHDNGYITVSGTKATDKVEIVVQKFDDSDLFGYVKTVEATEFVAANNWTQVEIASGISVDGIYVFQAYVNGELVGTTQKIALN